MRTLRARILTTTLVITGLAVIAFGVPLGVALVHLERARVVLRLEREASRILATVPDERLVSGVFQILPAPLDTSGVPMVVGVYAANGGRLSGAGPAQSSLAVEATTRGREASGDEAGQLVVALPLRTDRPSAAAVRVAVSSANATNDERVTWLAMLGLGAGILLLAGFVAFMLSRRLARPLEKLARNAKVLGEGDFTVRTDHTGVAEIDAAGASLDATAQRLGALLERERAFSSNASHQIRSPLAALRLSLETVPEGSDGEARKALGEAIVQLDRLESTLDGLLALTRDIEPPQEPFAVAPLMSELRERWAPQLRRSGRELVIDVPADAPEVRGSAASLQHVLDVLVDNAIRHGAGKVTVKVRRVGPAVAIDVADEGGGVTGDAEAPFQRRSRTARGHGIGLSLARSLVEADGGRLELRHPGPHPVFSVVLPAVAPLPVVPR